MVKVEHSESRMERKKEDTKQKILRVAMPLFVQNGVDLTTMEQIAEQADIARGTLYHYFPVKEAILDEYIKRSFQERYDDRIALLQQLPDTSARMTQILRDLIQGIRSQPDIFEKYFVYRIQHMISLTQSESAQSGFRSLGVIVIALGQQNGEIRTDLPLDILEALFEFAFVEVAQQYYRAPASFDADQTIAQCVDIFLHGAKG